MRASLFALALVCVTGCGSGSTKMPDMGMSAPDMTVAVDMVKLNCLGLITCIGGCTTTTCQLGCQSRASMVAVLDAEALSNCLSAACSMNLDAGAGSCASATDTSPGCQACVQAAAQGTQCAGALKTCSTD